MEKTRINLNGEFSAEDLDDIIRSLAEARAGMQPAVPKKAPGAHSSEDASVLHETIDSLVIRRLTGGRLRFYLRNSGLGWLAHEVSAEAAEGLASFLSNQIAHEHTLQ
jgi:hypothetical protein